MDGTFDQRAGAALRTILNDLKRTEEAAALELGIAAERMRAIIAGDEPLPPSLIERAVRLWPVNERDFYPLHDDMPDGVVVMRARDSERTARITQRGGADYYEYRDTAMSRLSMIRPEWIRILHRVGDDDADNPTVRWNSGHVLYQFTYFIGAVNYYFEWNGRRRCVPMNTGDSVFGLPFAPHTFTTRMPAEPGLILALTYGGRLGGGACHELAVLGGETAASFALDSSFAARLTALAGDAGMPMNEIAALAGLAPARWAELLAGAPAETAETERIGAALRVSPRELLGVVDDTADGVVIVRHRDALTWAFPEAENASYRVRRLAGSSTAPFARSLELDVLAPPGAAPLTTSFYEYGYNHGREPLALQWRFRGVPYETVIEPDDSFLVQPFVSHSFACRAGGRDGARVLLLRVAGKVAGDARQEASTIGAAGLRRIARDTTRWYPADIPAPERR